MDLSTMFIMMNKITNLKNRSSYHTKEVINYLQIHYHFQMMLINRDYPKIAATSASEHISQAISDANNEALFASIADNTRNVMLSFPGTVSEKKHKLRKELRCLNEEKNLDLNDSIEWFLNCVYPDIEDEK